MDTASHLLFGVTLAGAACLHPQIAEHPQLFGAVLAATLIGSHAPDFDTVTRLRSYAAYLRHHRGLTHAVPAWFIWPLVIALPLSSLFHVWESWPIVALWTFIAVMFHVGLDWLNAYGVQAALPFTSKWLHKDVLCLFDPVLFGIHMAVLSSWLWLDRQGASSLFAAAYALTFLYILWRWGTCSRVLQQLRMQFPGALHHQLIPDLSLCRWQYVVETEDCYSTGWVIQASPLSMCTPLRFDFHARYEKSFSLNPIIERTLATDGVRAFHGFAERVVVHAQQWKDGYKVVWNDVRFWHRRGLPFGVEVELDEQLNVVKTKLGWSKKGWEPPYV
ncbi:metal-dependent hydrolase [Paenibacillus profundus]|uniref:Metal-dependent hydrolase n=1 Tax=Paenibacillus profundus TaxID=1173085 RepID=A0ABS8YLK4_9BACL|nr:metal-dependent hydrolase [Paenibacillus profundus]MCE5172079.1 metal-dependent hydrolase [Paenibacillus profundus]